MILNDDNLLEELYNVAFNQWVNKKYFNEDDHDKSFHNYIHQPYYPSTPKYANIAPANFETYIQYATVKYCGKTYKFDPKTKKAILVVDDKKDHSKDTDHMTKDLANNLLDNLKDKDLSDMSSDIIELLKKIKGYIQDEPEDELHKKIDEVLGNLQQTKKNLSKEEENYIDIQRLIQKVKEIINENADIMNSPDWSTKHNKEVMLLCSNKIESLNEILDIFSKLPTKNFDILVDNSIKGIKYEIESLQDRLCEEILKLQKYIINTSVVLDKGLYDTMRYYVYFYNYLKTKKLLEEHHFELIEASHILAQNREKIDKEKKRLKEDADNLIEEWLPHYNNLVQSIFDNYVKDFDTDEAYLGRITDSITKLKAIRTKVSLMFNNAVLVCSVSKKNAVEACINLINTSIKYMELRSKNVINDSTEASKVLLNLSRIFKGYMFKYCDNLSDMKYKLTNLDSLLRFDSAEKVFDETVKSYKVTLDEKLIPSVIMDLGTLDSYRIYVTDNYLLDIYNLTHRVLRKSLDSLLDIKGGNNEHTSD